MYLLGYAVRTLGDDIAPAGSAHPTRFLAGLADAVQSCRRRSIGFYRLVTPADLQLSDLVESSAQIRLIAGLVSAAGLRLGVHLPPSMGLGHTDERMTARFMLQIEAAAHLLERLDSGSTHTVVSHLGAADGQAGLVRFAERYRCLSITARRRLTVEHSGNGYSLSDLCRLSAHCGVPVVFDTLHHQLHNPEGWSSGFALGIALATWPPGRRAEVHLSSQRTEAHLLPDGRVAAPRPGQHADFVRLDDGLRLLEDARGLPEFDIMIEAKAGDLALERLRDELKRSGNRWPGTVQRAMV